MFKINNTPVFEVIFNGTNANHGRHCYRARTLKSATDKLSWWTIFDKYGSKLPGRMEKGKDMPFGTVCECQEPDFYYGDPGPPWTDCPIHDRQTGYFARVQTRLSGNLFQSAMSLIDNRTINNKKQLIAGEPELILVSD